MPDPVELNIDDIVGKEPDTISTDEKTFLETNKDQLTTDELTKFGFSVEPVKPVTRSGETPPADPVKPPVVAPAPKEGEEDDEEAKRVSAIVDRRLAEERKTNQPKQNRIEVDNFVISNPDFAKYKDSIITHVNDPAYANVPIDRIAKMIAADDLMKIGARRERQAQQKVKETKNPSNGARDPGANGGPNWLTATKEDFEAKKREIMGHRS